MPRGGQGVYKALRGKPLSAHEMGEMSYVNCI